MTALITPNDDLLISAYLDDELDAPAREKLELRLEHDAALRERLEIMAFQADQLADGSYGEDVPPVLQNRIDAILDAGFGLHGSDKNQRIHTFLTDEKFLFPATGKNGPDTPNRQNSDDLLTLATYQQQNPVPATHALTRQAQNSQSETGDTMTAMYGKYNGYDQDSTVEHRPQPRSTGKTFARWWAGAGMAAALAIAFFAGSIYQRTTTVTQHPVIATNGKDSTKLDSAGLDMLINETLETTQSGQVKKAALATDSEKIGKTSIEPLRTFQLNGRFCREYRADIDMGQKKPITFFGRACRDPKDGWQTVYRLFPGAAADLGSEPLAAHQNL
ncbi:hypothetical protein [Thalassospira sp. TSL5-1]|uniref:hypothetical protein n=1 Tax=Thalassospira sp. TSL5-1 TaxID=1544451 RepID=UPI00093A1656|nr:hypothetical protein [Thalassospira sp. TSL5-1]